jgi:hypothetical protein
VGNACKLGLSIPEDNSIKQIILTAPLGYRDTVQATLESHDIDRCWWEAEVPGSEMFSVRLISHGQNEQKLLDDLQRTIGAAESATIYTTNIDSWYPGNLSGSRPPMLTRDELLIVAESGARMDSLYLLLVVLSTIVAGIGLLEDNIAVVIGAMVIAPLLGPNLSSALGIALGEFRISRKAAVSLVVGVLLALFVALLLGYLWPAGQPGPEILSRTQPGIDTPFWCCLPSMWLR